MKVQTDAPKKQKASKAIYDTTQICKTFVLDRTQQTIFCQISYYVFLIGLSHYRMKLLSAHIIFVLFLSTLYRVSINDQNLNIDWSKNINKWNYNFEEPLTQNNNLDDSIKIKIFKTETGWGYDIIINQRLYIHQSNIPALGGNQSFKTNTDAKKVAALVKQKIKNNIIPPTITINELDSLNIKRG